ncbi:MAG TPA: TetR/AcrR family transcriptional regulator, partial [Acidimicrobiia bacterium]|nr:TetR/AcrR family transcriptional regulator [Acidimicrobiia bacterium]
MPANATRTTPDGAPPRRPRARPGEGERLREQILDAATGLLVRSGDERTVSVRSVAKEVGCTPAALYLHFADRDEMIFAVCERQFARLARRIDAAMEGLDDPLDALRAIGRAYIAFGLE